METVKINDISLSKDIFNKLNLSKNKSKIINNALEMYFDNINSLEDIDLQFINYDDLTLKQKKDYNDSLKLKDSDYVNI